MGFAIPAPQRKPCRFLRQITNCTDEEILVDLQSTSAEMTESQHAVTAIGDNYTQYQRSQIASSIDTPGQSSQCQSSNLTLTPDMLADRSWLYTEESLHTVFYWVLFTNGLFEMTFEPLQSVTDAEAVNTLEELGLDVADYGKQRAFGSLGWGVM